MNLLTATIADIHAAYATGRLSAEILTAAYLGRIRAYNDSGPAINAVITMNQAALDEARARDEERRLGHARGILHGIPIVLKDNLDTYDIPTTAGSQLLEGHIPASDAFVVRKLRQAGAVVVAKVNMSEFAGSGGDVGAATDPAVIKAARVPGGYSTMGLQTLNPHDLMRSPGSSSGGTGAAISAAFAQFGLGTDTGGSIRSPSSANGIVGLKPTLGLVSRTGIVPLALSFDTPGPMARSIYDSAVALSVMAGFDPLDSATRVAKNRAYVDYTKYLRRGALKGACIGVARDFMGRNDCTDKVVENAISTLISCGAKIVDPIRFPEYLLRASIPIYDLIVAAEFKKQISEYLRGLPPHFPRTLDELAVKASEPRSGYRRAQKAFGLRYTASTALDLDDPVYLATKSQALLAIKAGVDSIFEKYKLDAIVYPTLPEPASLINPPDEASVSRKSGGADNYAVFFASETGYPDLVVPAGMTERGLPVTISFLGSAWSEPKLFGYGYEFEQATKSICLPRFTPELSSDFLNC